MPRFGLYFGATVPLATLIELARHAEAAGFDGWFCTEHHQQPGINPSPLTMLAVLAGVTERIQLGTAVLLPPLYHAVRLAADAAVLDALSGGRLILGAGLGYQQGDFDAFGTPLSHRVSLLEESIAILKLAWTGEPFSFDGRRYQLKDVTVTPRPAQHPRPPIWLAGWSEPGVRRAARIGDAWLTDPILSLDAVQTLRRAYNEECRAAATAPAVALMRSLAIGQSRSAAEETYADAAVGGFRYYWRHGALNPELEPWLNGVANESELTWANLAPGRVIHGTPEDCVDQLQRWFGETGGEYVIVSISPGPGRDRYREMKAAMDLFGREVIPAFRG